MSRRLVTFVALVIPFSPSGLGVASEDAGPEHNTPAITSAPVDRAYLAEQIRARVAAEQSHHARELALERREQAGESVAAEKATLKKQRPTFLDLKDDAQRVIDANPTDDAAFLAIAVVLRTTAMTPQNATSLGSTADSAVHRHMATLLLNHHLRRPDLL